MEDGKFGIIGIFQLSTGKDGLTLFQEYCNGAGLTLVGQKVTRTEEKEGVFHVDFEKKVQVARETLGFLADKVAKLPENAKFNVELIGVSQWHEIISSPDQMPAAKELGISLTRDWVRKNTGAVLYGNLAFFLLTLCQIFGILGLIAALFIQSNSGFHIQLLQIGVALYVPLWDVISLFLVFLGFFAMLSPAYWRIPTLDRVTSTVPVPRKVGVMIRHFFLKPINLVTLVVMICVVFTWVS